MMPFKLLLSFLCVLLVQASLASAQDVTDQFLTRLGGQV